MTTDKLRSRFTNVKAMQTHITSIPCPVKRMQEICKCLAIATNPRYRFRLTADDTADVKIALVALHTELSPEINRMIAAVRKERRKGLTYAESRSSAGVPDVLPAHWID